MPDPVHRSTPSASLVASVRVPAAALETSLGPLVVRARLQRMTAASEGRGAGEPVIRAVLDPVRGVALESDDGVFRTPIRDASVSVVAPVSVVMDARELQRAVSEIVIGVDAEATPLTLAISPGATIVELTRERPAGRTSVMRALLGAVTSDGATLPLLAAFATRAAFFAATEPAALDGDRLLDRVVDAVRQSLLNREYEVWAGEMPAWIVAASEVLDECDATARARLAAAAEDALNVPDEALLTESDRELAYAMVLFAACHDGRDRIPGPVRGPVPMALLAEATGDPAIRASAAATLIPSQRERFTTLAGHAGLGAAAPAADVSSAVVAREIGQDESPLDAETNRYLALVARGEVREVNASFALRLTAVPVHVLRGAMIAHGRLDDAALASLSADERALATAVADAWPGTTLNEDTLGWIASAADRAAARLESTMQQAAKQKRQEAQRRTRQLTVRQLVPTDIGSDATRRIRVPSAVEPPASVSTRVGDLGAPTAAPDARTLQLPPAPLAFAAVDAGAPILCDLANGTAVVMIPPATPDGAGEQYALLSTWSAEPVRALATAIVQQTLSAPSADLVVLWGDEVLAARAAAAAMDPSVAANPADGVAAFVTRTDTATCVHAGSSVLTVGAERTGLVVALRERLERVANAAERSLTFDTRRVPVSEDVTIALGAQAASAAARQGVGRPVDAEGDLTDAAPRVDVVASAGTGYVALHDGTREHILAPAVFPTAGRPTRATLPPTLLSDALDVARSSTTAQEAARTEPHGARFSGATRLRLQPYGEAVAVDRGRVCVTALRVDDVLDGDVTTAAAEPIEERESSAAIAILSARAVL